MFNRRALLTMLGMAAAGPALAAEGTRRPRPRRRTATTALAGGQPRNAASRVPGELPQIDPVPQRSASGLDPAPTPSSNPRPASADMRARTDLDFGVSAPRQAQQGASFGPADTSRDPASNSGSRVPNVGATVRVPF
ncbi:hypothetical protein M0638_17690 [Roseomonas sp. NAR14]|uniref:Uncharacterized protein n=1 Tax=Roseomonas acroporae TaxID=2937791 RepID=A0A9X1YCJ7_9PROT|nr:hypothetical protein [Roseomonas acroporae]MCK8786212.1 hypothetical protein [Roseomonas acroporae]